MELDVVSLTKCGHHNQNNRPKSPCTPHHAVRLRRSPETLVGDVQTDFEHLLDDDIEIFKKYNEVYAYEVKI